MNIMLEHLRKFGLHTCCMCVMLFANIHALFAQKRVPCNRSLAAASKEYETGNFAYSVKLLSGCLGSYSKQEGIEAYRLLALNHQALNDESKAIEAAQKMLQLKPDYREFPYFDPIEFTKLLSGFDIWPRLEVGLKVGLNLNTIRLGNGYSITNAGQTFSPGWGGQAGFVGEYFLEQKWSFNGEVLFERLGYSMEAEPISGWKQRYEEKLNYVSIPITARYYFLKRKNLCLAAEAGLQTQVLLSTTSNFVFEYAKTGYSYRSSAQLNDNRKNVLFYGLGGLVVKQKVGFGMLVGSVRYAVGLNKKVNSDKRYSDINFVLSNQYVDNDIRFNPLYFTIGYQIPVEGMYAVKMRK
jgi:hypothetical protein